MPQTKTKKGARGQDGVPGKGTHAWHVLKLLAATSPAPMTSAQIAAERKTSTASASRLLHWLSKDKQLVRYKGRATGYSLTVRGLAAAQSLGFKIADAIHPPHQKKPRNNDAAIFADYHPQLAAERQRLQKRIEAIDAFASAWLVLRSSNIESHRKT